MRAPFILSIMLMAASLGCSYAPAKTALIQTQPAVNNGPVTPAAEQPADAKPRVAASECDKDFDAFNVNKDTFLSVDEYVEGKFSQVRFFKAPTEQEIATMKAGLRKDAQALDQNGDGKLSREEYRAACQ